MNNYCEHCKYVLTCINANIVTRCPGYISKEKYEKVINN